eukprot:3469678-Pleurochrysis_carterae.AAC.1
MSHRVGRQESKLAKRSSGKQEASSRALKPRPPHSGGPLLFSTDEAACVLRNCMSLAPNSLIVAGTCPFQQT